MATNSTPRRRASDKAPAAPAPVITDAAASVGTPQPVAYDASGAPMAEISLAAIVALTVAGGFAYTDAATHQPLIASGDVEINTAVVHASGMIGTRATAQAIAKMSEPQTQTAPATAPAAAKPSFEIETGVALPAVKRNVLGHGNTKYPFDKLEIGQSFFVPGGSVKALASTVASANARFSEEVPGQNRVNRKGKTVPVTNPLRKFVVRNDTKEGVSGARIGRVALSQ